MKKRMLKKVITAAMLLAMSFSLAACGTENGNGESGRAGNGESGVSEGETTDGLPKEIRIGYWKSPNSELLVKQQGALENLYPDVSVNWVEFTSGADILTAIQADSIDLATIGTPPGTTGIVNEYPYYIYYLEDIIGGMEGLIVRENSGIDTIKDIEGKTIATSFGTTSHFSFLKAMEFEGVDISKVNILDMDASDIYAAWDRGDIDGAYIWESVKSQILNDGGKEIISSAEVADKGAVTGEFGIVRKEFYEKYPNVVSDYIDLLDAATDLFNNHAEDAAKLLSEGLRLSEDETLNSMGVVIELTKADQTKYLGTTENPGSLAGILKDTSDFLHDQGKLKDETELEVFQKAILTELYD